MTDSEDLRAAIDTSMLETMIRQLIDWHVGVGLNPIKRDGLVVDIMKHVNPALSKALTKERQRLRIATPCPACKHTSLILSADNWLVCGNLECNDPAAINNQQSKGEQVEVITRYAKGEPDTYSVDGGETYLTREEFDSRG